MANKFLGVGVNFGVSATTLTGTGIGTFKLQSSDHSKKAKIDDIQDGDGRTVQRSVYDEMEEATFEYVVFGTGLADAKAQTTIPDIGIIVAVADSADAAIAASNWLVVDVSKKRSNTGSARVTLKLEKIPGITAVQGA